MTALGISTLGLAANAFAAGQITNVIVAPTVTTGGTTGVTFNISFTTPSTQDIKAFEFLFTTTPSDVGGSNNILLGATKPNNFTIPGTPTAVAKKGGVADTNFSVASTVNGGGNGVILTATTAETGIGANTAWTFAIPTLTLPAVGDCTASATITDTCYVRIISFLDTGTTIIDQAVGSFTFTTQINLTATVDPYMTFSVSGVNATWSNYDTNIVETGTLKGITTTSATSIPFGNITVGTNKFAMQQLDVRTNASTGYKVYQKMTTSAHAFVGTFGSNHIDPFDNGSSWDSAGAPTATAWAEPTGLVNVLSGWLGLQSAGPTGNSAIGANWVGPVTNGGGTGGIVKAKASPDNGVTGNSGNPSTDASAGTSAYVTYRISVDAYQPADSYTGTMQYNVVANY